MDNWDDDDFDVTASAQSKIVDLGLDKKVKTPAPKVDDKRQAELEGLEAEKESDFNATLALLDIAPIDTSKKFETIKTRRQFEDYGNEMGQLYKSRSKDVNYMSFALPLIKETTANMSKIQLEEVQKVVQDYLNVYIKKEQEQKKAAEQKKQQKQKKKAVHHDDMIEGDYGDYEDKYY
uniref:Eukaryotic translation initiation factor 3 30 kDa subunit n=1 Tax=Panagrellus redivivus TaxID=6233 RepID=A0A7E4WE73_PANRE